MNSGICSLAERDGWHSVIGAFRDMDVYFFPEYHEIVRGQDEDAFLFWYREGDRVAVLPFLRRPVACVPGLKEEPDFDGVTAYGYSGAIANDPAVVPKSEFVSGFQAELTKRLTELGMVALFSRQHPLLGCEALLAGLGEIEERGTTVVLRLEQSPEAQWGGISKGHRYDIRKAERMGVKVREGSAAEDLDTFIGIYNQTMTEIGARRVYFFPRCYYDELFQMLGRRVRLFLAEVDGVAVSAALFFFQSPIVQYHLSGTPREQLKYLGAKVILNEVRKLGAQEGYRWLHLGGGVGGAEDALFRFKAGFSKERLPFKTVKIVVDADRYDELVDLRRKAMGGDAGLLEKSAFFPVYRMACED